ncbi:hypothetical protein GQ43DRAFT_262447 [Delitschia confertaspora ATCC 74209]|uniref:Protein BNI4 n=1 Tax=Delitschia confertaspora ATCC 74209 TaxID=1513339 RepID=A0A9P4MXP9_9PLEO|nr:hypothetical protein GQ43DRAFT_262447 [Delitschia confertaspora ATCC 74209]
MAQVLAPIVQTSGSLTMLHTSPDAFQNNPSAQSHQQSRSSQMPRNQTYNAQNTSIGYRGTSTAPIAPYAFSSTPQLRQENKPSAHSGPYPQQQNAQHNHSVRLGHPSHASSSSDSTVSTSGSSSRSLTGPPLVANEDTAMVEARKSTADNLPVLAFSSSIPDLSLSALDVPVKPSPDRYRRGTRRTDSSSSAVTGPATPTQTHPSSNVPAISAAGLSTTSLPASDIDVVFRPSHNRANSDDLQMPRQGSGDQAKRYRRRSLGSLEPNSLASENTTSISESSAPTATPLNRAPQENAPMSNLSRPSSQAGSIHERRESTGSTASATTRPSSSRQDSSSLGVPTNSNRPSSRGSAEPAKRVAAPSPLSKPMLPSEPQPAAPAKRALMSNGRPNSPAVQQLAALNDKESGKGMKSRLRRAFSFGSAAELRKASAENNLSARNKLQKEQYPEELDPEQQAIIAKQEAAGIGAGIYNGQGGFTGSTDNVSISSTASSASIMLRKMGNGMKRGTRSIKGLFRPKSVIGVPAADNPVMQPSVAQVSMVTVEAERDRVNVNANPHDQVGGGTGYPRLERNSMDASQSGRSDLNRISNMPAADPWSRKSIIGGERERAEVLSNIKKGILKRSGTNSPSTSPLGKPTDIHHHNDSPKSSAPSTPNDDNSRPVHVHINGEDYFGPPRIGNGSTRSLPNSPHGGTRNISFSPRIQFHDAWSSSEYDRRGDIATCNRLTPMLAQQIKEELNSFKMEMEVHELSKPHTHFF